MRRIFSDFAYGPGPRDGCWWDETCDLPLFAPLAGAHRCDVVIVGAGFTGVSAALHLARAGADVIVVDAGRVGWGASGRNGGFCCLGGGVASDAILDRRFGRTERLRYRATERAAVDLVAELIDALGLDVDRHSDGETLLAHRARDARGFDAAARRIEENYGVVAHIEVPAQAGMGGAFHSALTTPIGFGLNPRKYVAGLVAAAVSAGVRFFDQTAVHGVTTEGVETQAGHVRADRVIVATNGYSSEDVPAWMRARYLPVQSNVLVTRPMTDAEQRAQGWTSGQMAYDTRHLLHYFRRLPDNRFLFGRRGGLTASPAAEARARTATEADFRRMFPAWHGVTVTHAWSGLACLSRSLVPFVGPVPDMPGALAGFAYHGNGVAMGTFAGACLATLALGKEPDLWPRAMQTPPERFPAGNLRRALLYPVYAGYAVMDRLP
ncbi:MAG: FAD-binding oxidoreductase [Pseudomonadota bacterium]